MTGPFATHSPRDPEFEARVRSSFARQHFMAVLGASCARVVPGEVVLEFPYREDLTQQHGFLHAGVVTAVADSACGYAALSLMETGSAVLSVEFKVNLLAPAAGVSFAATGRVVRSGRTLTVCTAEVTARQSAGEVLIAIMQATMVSIRDRAGMSD